MSTIPRCFDSHLHLIPTGEIHTILNLRDLKDSFALPIPEGARRGRWLLGFGWQAQPSLEAFREDLVAFSRADGHALLLNEPALRELGFWKTKSEWPSDLVEFVDFDAKGWPSGVVRDRVSEIAFHKIPKMTVSQSKAAALSAISLFRNQGFTHLREMMADRDTWQILQMLDENGELRAYLDVNFHCPKLSDLSAVLRDYETARSFRSSRLRADGIKFFVDGAMGSDGALLTEPYVGQCKHGHQLWTEAELEDGFERCWGSGIPVAVHAIGDRAVRLTLATAQKLLRRGVTGLLHLEHLQMMNPQDIALFRDLCVYSHFQPSHFLADRAWLREKLGDRAGWVFPWKTLEMYGYPFFFGSDSPIETPSLKKTKDALRARAEFGQKPLEMDWTFPHSHPDTRFGANCSTTVDPEGNVVAVVLDGERIF